MLYLQFDKPGIDPEKGNSHYPIVNQHGHHSAGFVKLPQAKSKKPLGHDEMEILVDGEGFYMGNAKFFNISAIV
ncbi:hypothetical protein [Acidaminococcus fermentans]|uniref:hypothetical protein n=1 Tax=Acidaminococcus fermentans TaxID=905 RepID=UPI003F8C283B